MAKPNYNFEKRQRDLAKQKKQEEKRQKKLSRKADGTDEDSVPDDESNGANADDGPAAG